MNFQQASVDLIERIWVYLLLYLYILHLVIGDILDLADAVFDQKPN